MNTRKWKLRRLALLVGFLLAMPAVQALGSSAFDWRVYVGLEEEVLISATTWNETDDGELSPSTEVSVERGPLTGGTFRVIAAVRTGRNDLLGVRFLVADDADADGTIEAHEWVEMASATAQATPDGTAAVTTAVTVSAFHDGYRIEHTWDDFGTSYDEVVRRELETE